MKYNVGDKFGHLQVVSFKTYRNENYNRTRTVAVCTCHKCGKTDYETLPYNFRTQKSCGCDRVWAAPPAGEQSKLYKGYKELSRTFFNNCENRAKRKNIHFDLTLKFLWELFEKQDRKCAISGEPIHFGQPIAPFEKGTRRYGATASVDRINPQKGYTQDNVQWVHVDINYMKHKFQQEKFIDLCRKVCIHNQIPFQEIK